MSETLPATQWDWKERAEKCLQTGETLHNATLTSGSKVQEKQFLLFQVLWKDEQTRALPLKEYELDQFHKAAGAFLKDYPSWNVYKENISRRGDMSKVEESTFALVLDLQHGAALVTEDEVSESLTFALSPVSSRTRQATTAKDRDRYNAQTPTRRKPPKQPTMGGLYDEESEDEDMETPATVTPPTKQMANLRMDPPAAEEVRELTKHQSKDEQIVNAALISFLSALTLHGHRGTRQSLDNAWSLHRLPLIADFGDACYEARTDGYLYDKGKGGGTIRALVEVKAAQRARKEKPIRMQEAAQMVAWLKCHPERERCLNKPGRRLHVSQDRNEIYIIVAEYNMDYLDFLNGNGDSNAFMIMHEYGPWDTGTKVHMEALAPILVAVALRAAADRKEEEKMRKK
ncbi:hypothetical protein BJX64DRAFT_288927 [Aspergillus heterothallicus]